MSSAFADVGRRRFIGFEGKLGFLSLGIGGTDYQCMGGGIGSDEANGVSGGHFDIISTCGQADNLICGQLPSAIPVINPRVNLARNFYGQVFRHTTQGAGELGCLTTNNGELVYGDIGRQSVEFKWAELVADLELLAFKHLANSGNEPGSVPVVDVV